MEPKTNLSPADRKVLLEDYRADIQRRLDYKAASSENASAASDWVTRFLVSEIAQLKLQVTELELASVRSEQSADNDVLRPAIDHVWPSMPTYDVGSRISIGAGVMTFGFHFPELGAGGVVQRWSGPSTRAGLVALINRTAPLFGELSNVSFIDPSVEITRVLIDGEPVKHEWLGEKTLRFLIPPISNTDRPVPTQIAFVVNKCLVVQDVRPQFMDTRSVGFCTIGLTLRAAAPDPS